MGWNYCETCHGNGDVRDPSARWWRFRRVTCPTCKGTRNEIPGPRPKPPGAPPPREPELVGHVTVADIRPGDRLVFTFDGQLSTEAYSHFQHIVKQWAPDCKCLLLEGGTKMGIVRNTETP